jgi:hypothetical protein
VCDDDSYVNCDCWMCGRVYLIMQCCWENQCNWRCTFTLSLLWWTCALSGRYCMFMHHNHIESYVKCKRGGVLLHRWFVREEVFSYIWCFCCIMGDDLEEFWYHMHICVKSRRIAYYNDVVVACEWCGWWWMCLISASCDTWIIVWM